MKITPVIKLENVHKRFAYIEAVRGVNLEVHSGEFLAIIGSSGCGKTTTLRMIAGLDNPTSGDIYIHGSRVNDLKPWHRETPLVWQNFALFPHMSISENVGYGLRMRGVSKEQRQISVQKVLRTVGLEGMENRSVVKLSGGQKQRVGLARALVLDPKILLLDEPLGALDAKIARSMQRELKRLHQELGITFIYVTHNQSEALGMADRVVVMDKGEIQQIGPPDHIYRKPQNQFIAEFVGTNNVFTGNVVATKKGRAIISTPQGDFHTRTPKDNTIGLGDDVTFIVGADKLKLREKPSSGDNIVEGKVTATEFNGSITVVFVTLMSGFEIKFHQQYSHPSGNKIVVGDSLELSWHPMDAHLLPG